MLFRSTADEELRDRNVCCIRCLAPVEERRGQAEVPQVGPRPTGSPHIAAEASNGGDTRVALGCSRKLGASLADPPTGLGRVYLATGKLPQRSIGARQPDLDRKPIAQRRREGEASPAASRRGAPARPVDVIELAAATGEIGRAHV